MLRLHLLATSAVLLCNFPNLIAALPLWDSAAHSAVQARSCNTSSVPQTVVLDGQRLADAKSRLQAGDDDLQEVLDNLLVQANKYLSQGPWTVTDNEKSVPNGTIYDYASQAPYWWPNNWNSTSTNSTSSNSTSSNNDTCPYVQRDGVVNPEASEYTSKTDRASMFTSSYTLSLAWYYTDNSTYREHAANIIKTWFLDESTAMTPHLKHSQIIPCDDDGRSIGILDFSQQYTDVLDAAAILSVEYDTSWSNATETAFKAWNGDFLEWLTDSDFGQTELAADNNHGTYARLQIAGVAAYVGQTDLAISMANGTKSVIDSQFTANGPQPLELSRTRSFHYSCFNLVAHARLADIGYQLGVDLWGYEGASGQSILGAIDFLVPYATGNKTWPYNELSFVSYAASDLINAASDQGDETASAALTDLTYPSIGNQWPLRPSAERLDDLDADD
ncbi:hypothetical protein I350_06907 [Cryptococcus amylolentus CBS 6273]|uniref:Alginate lyase domain-containing protein n=1 Tax=Cryptococcus amylolentus CBS 6273 TaxID=1296118 RepID=A0A1E3JJH5_9TREE|nr:hypothetical protein I350_06907 [Cryptococcus amylolentus CBS 6273]